jgi:hypothetical protein
MNVARRRREAIVARSLFRMALALWLIQTLVLASAALLLLFSDDAWVDRFEQYQLVRNFMANPVEMIVVEAFGTLCILVGIFGVVEAKCDLLDTVWAGYGPFFIGVSAAPIHAWALPAVVAVQVMRTQEGTALGVEVGALD